MAEERTIRTVLELDASRFVAGAAKSATAAKALTKELAGVERGGNYDRVANSLLGVGTAAAAGMGVAVKAAMDWESAWAGVTKTVDGTPSQLAAVEDGLRGLARELPATHTEIAAVAEAAGQLGIQTKSVVGFTKTMINLGETTNLSADEAATSLARFSNIMGTSQDDVDKLGSTLVGLGNNFATTEAEIMAMGMRLAGVGNQLNLSEGDVLGLAAAMSSVGIEAEAGGTAMSTGMKKINDAVGEGGDELAAFADVAGMSADAFAALWQKDSAAALDAFVHGLARAGDEGQNVSQVLADLGIKGIRESDTFLRLAGASDMLSKALAQGNDEFEKNTALVEEAAKRYETTESKVKIAKNALVDAAINIGAQVLPMIASLAEHAAGLAEAFANLPAPVQNSIVAIGAITAAAGLAAGGLLKIIPAASETLGAFTRLKNEAPRTAAALGKAGKAAGVAAGLFVGLNILSGVADGFRQVSAGAEEMTSALMNASKTGSITTATVDNLVAASSNAGFAVHSVGDALDMVNASWFSKGIESATAGLAGFDTTAGFASERLGELDKAITSLATAGQMDQMTTTFQAAVESAKEYGYTAEDLVKQLPELRTELTNVATEMGLEADAATLAKIATGEIKPKAVDAADGTKALGDATEETADAVDTEIEKLTELGKVLHETASMLLGARSAHRQFEEAIDSANEAVKENGKTLDISTEKGRANEAALDALADATLSYAEEAVNMGKGAKELDEILQNGRDEFIKTAEAMGMGTEEAKNLADELQLIPGTYVAAVKADVSDAQKDLDKLTNQEPPKVYTKAYLDSDEYKNQFDALVMTDSKVTINADPTQAIISAEEATAALDSIPDVKARIDGDTKPLQTKADETFLLMAYLQAEEATPTVDLDDDDLVRVAMAATERLEELDKMEPTPEVKAEKDVLERVVVSAKKRLDSIPDKKVAKIQAETYGTADVKTLRDRIAGLRDKTVMVRAVMDVGNAFAKAFGKADGGWIAPSRAAGGWVPGEYPGPGVDNVLWPFAPGAAGGRYLAQPLAGDEFVVNGRQARMWGPALEAINAGAVPSKGSQITTTFSPAFTINGPDPTATAREALALYRHEARAATAELY